MQTPGLDPYVPRSHLVHSAFNDVHFSPSLQLRHFVSPLVSWYSLSKHVVQTPGLEPYVPRSQLEQLALPVEDACPMGQVKQAVGESFSLRYVPETHLTHGVPASPGWQSLQKELPLRARLPVPQATHSVEPDVLDIKFSLQSVHSVAPIVFINEPGMQGKHDACPVSG